ncbi:hypothetical protein HCA69_15585 [Listeria grandensis]|uniref:Uncharacterized protein n=1 Tax=Listeria grandensis TaxID=1494963 RepID=A0A7X0Y697_9LIST|nr:hypothetical protein [Listeria grandensis]MBC1937791.1 hypothetical protein [Listeria grandensis]
MTECYKIAKGDEFYEDAEKIHHQDWKAFSEEVSDLLGFEAKGNIAFNRKKLLVKESALEEFKPEWVSMFKLGGGEYLTPKVSQKQLIDDYAALREKYNMDMNFNLLLMFSEFSGGAEIIFDFDDSGFVYMELDKKQGEEVHKRYTVITEIEFAERKLESLKYKKESVK